MTNARKQLPPRVPFLLFLVLAAAPAAAGDATPQGASSLGRPGDYSKEAVVVQKVATEVVLAPDGTSTIASAATVRVQSDAGVRGFEVLVFSYQQGSEALDIEYVRVRHADGTVVATPQENVQDLAADVSRVAPMYSDIHEKHVTVKSLGVGDLLEYSIRAHRSKPEIPGQFWFSYSFNMDAITEDELLDITVPRATYLHVSSPGHEPAVREAGSNTIYSWKSSHLEHEPAAARRVPPYPSVEVTTFHAWEEVGRWYGGLAAPAAAPTPAIRRKAAELTSGMTTDEAKIRALYDFVSARVHYISLSFGAGRFRPHDAEQVLANQYGDCKDKHTLLAALLEASGFEAWPALVSGSTEIDPDLPSPGQFDHVITVVKAADALWWLDTTPEVAPFRMLTPNLRGKRALVIPRSRAASLMTTPEAPPFPMSQRFTADGRLAPDGTFTGRIRWVVRGDSEILLRSEFRGTPQPQWTELGQKLSAALGFAGEVASVAAGSPEDTSTPFELSYDYTRRKLGDNGRLVLPIPPIGVESDPDEKARTEPITLGLPGTLTYRSTIELPPGTTVVLPSPVHLSDDFAGYDATYRFDGRVLTVERVFVIRKPKVPLTDVSTFQKIRDAVTQDESASVGMTAAGQATDNDSAVDGMLRQAASAMERHDPAAAEELYRRVLRVAPDRRGVHYGVGAALLLQNKEAGVAEIRKEEELYPDDPFPFQMLGRYFQITGRTTEALEQWRAVARLQPKDRDAAATAAGLLIAAKRYDEAIAVLQPALAAAPDAPSLHSAAAYAYVRSGKPDLGVAEFRKAIELDPSAGRLNDTAFEIADRGVFLDTAKEWAERALASLAADSAHTSLASLGPQDLRRTTSFASYWDTLGWTCFRRGELDAAERYLRAAWQLSQSAVQGDHLAQVYEKRGDTAAAARILELAYVSAASSAKDGILEHYRRLTGHNPTTRASNDPFGELVRMRTSELPTITRKNVSAEFYLLVSAPARIEDVRFISGDDALKDAGRQLASLKLGPVFPGDQAGRLVRRGIVSCGETGCELVLMLPANVKALD